MSFIEIKRSYKNDRKLKSTRCCFFKKPHNKYSLYLAISCDLLEELNFDIKKKVTFLVDENNPKIWLLKQNTESNRTLTKVRSSAVVSITWNLFKIPENATKTKELKHDFYDGGLRIYYED